jgi:hypothetical protein
VEIVINKDYVALANDGRVMSGFSAVQCDVGLGIGYQWRRLGTGLTWSNVPRYGIDREGSLKIAAEQFAKARDLIRSQGS